MNFFSLLNFTAENLSLLFSALLLTKRLCQNKTSNYGKLVLSIFTLYIAEILLIEILLGSFGTLFQTNVATFVYGWTIVTTLILHKNIFKRFQIEHKTKLPIITIIAVFTPIALALFIFFFNNMLQIPMEYDSAAYHLPFVAKWLQTGSLLHPYFTAFSSSIGYYPSTYELLDLWTAIPFKSDFFFNLLNFPILILLTFTIYKICQNFKISKNISIISAGLLLYMPLFLKQAGTPLVDAFFALAFALSIYFIQEIIKNKKQALDLICLGLSLGFLIGSKYLGIPYSLILIILFLIFCHKPKAVLITFFSLFLTGSFFYIRNWLATGNPIFPVEIKLLGHVIFSGYQGLNDVIDSTALIHHLSNFADLNKLRALLYQQIGPQIYLIFLSLGLNFFIIIFELFRKNLKKILPLIFLTLGGLIYFYLYLKSPYTYQQEFENIRYAVPFFVIGCLNIAWLANYFKKLKYLFYFGAFALFSYNFTHLIHFSPPEIKLTSTYQLYISFLAISFAFLFYSLVHKKFLISLFSLIIGLGFFFQVSLYTATERENLIPYFTNLLFSNKPSIDNIIQASQWINQNAPNAKIAYSSFNYHYHLFGRNLQREVDYININSCQNCDYYNFRNVKDGIRSNPDYENWLKNLAAQHKEYLILDTKFTPNVNPYEFDWANTHPEKFTQVWQKDNTYIYKITT